MNLSERSVDKELLSFAFGSYNSSLSTLCFDKFIVIVSNIELSFPLLKKVYGVVYSSIFLIIFIKKYI
jgi:hypothetical protein